MLWNRRENKNLLNSFLSFPISLWRGLFLDALVSDFGFMSNKIFISLVFRSMRSLMEWRCFINLLDPITCEVKPQGETLSSLRFQGQIDQVEENFDGLSCFWILRSIFEWKWKLKTENSSLQLCDPNKKCYVHTTRLRVPRENLANDQTRPLSSSRDTGANADKRDNSLY